ncbi:MAG: spermidine/putrescine ABC transporter substrate-binding protein [Nanoarchaeota archaeon]|nr:spermidine/putrescine ABC transporter substrate-binding protein [Nanoarchaeota archaeon]
MEIGGSIVLGNLIMYFVVLFSLLGILFSEFFTLGKDRRKGVSFYIILTFGLAAFIIINALKHFEVKFPSVLLWVNPFLIVIIGAAVLWNSYYVKGMASKKISFLVFFFSFVIAVTEIFKIIFIESIDLILNSFASGIFLLLIWAIIIDFLRNISKGASGEKQKLRKKELKIFFIFGLSSLIVLGVILISISLPILFKPQLSDELNIFVWADYFDDFDGDAITFEEFEKEFGVKINSETFLDDGVMLETDLGKYDLIIIDNDLLEEMVERELLAPIRTRNIPNLKDIDERCVMKEFEEYLAPYFFGTTGLAINTKYIPEDTDSWDVLWNSKYKGKIKVLDHDIEVIAMTAKYLGLPLIPQTESELKQVEKFLLLQRPLIKGYHDLETIRAGLVSEEIWAAQNYGILVRVAAFENENIKYIFPKEGLVKWVDNFAIVRSSPNKYTAEVFINYINRPSVNIRITEFQLGYSCNKETMKFLGEDFLPEIPPEVLKFFEFLSDYDESEEIRELREELWEELTEGMEV